MKSAVCIGNQKHTGNTLPSFSWSENVASSKARKMPSQMNPKEKEFHIKKAKWQDHYILSRGTKM
jgi:hypothetical protein